MISTKTRVEDRVKTLLEYADPSAVQEAEDVTCENFMTEKEGTHSVLMRGVVYDWDSDAEKFVPRK